jgi:hypothetical protein
MSHAKSIGLWSLSMTLAAVLMGCTAEQPTDSPASTATPPAPMASEVDTEVRAALAKLSPEDRAAAEAQKTCPVTDELLGSMGTPIKVTIEGRDVFVCCEGCIDELKNNFGKYADKLTKQS